MKIVFFQTSGILGQNVHHFGDVPGSVPRRARMIGKFPGSGQPGNRRQLAFVHVFAELIKQCLPSGTFIVCDLPSSSNDREVERVVIGSSALVTNAA